jgi:hypothetical protein
VSFFSFYGLLLIFCDVTTTVTVWGVQIKLESMIDAAIGFMHRVEAKHLDILPLENPFICLPN